MKALVKLTVYPDRSSAVWAREAFIVECRNKSELIAALPTVLDDLQGKIVPQIEKIKWRKTSEFGHPHMKHTHWDV